ncbi:hypothetical protein BH09MYX1_BH09MYX1_15360 [soil metagenome]
MRAFAFVPLATVTAVLFACGSGSYQGGTIDAGLGGGSVGASTRSVPKRYRLGATCSSVAFRELSSPVSFLADAVKGLAPRVGR